jgi:hypothetical protein
MQNLIKIGVIFNKFKYSIRQESRIRLNIQNQTLKKQSKRKIFPYLLKKGKSALRLKKWLYFQCRYLILNIKSFRKWIQQFKIWIHFLLIRLYLLKKYYKKFKENTFFYLALKKWFLQRFFIFKKSIKQLANNIHFLNKSILYAVSDFKIKKSTLKLILKQLLWYKKFAKRSWIWNFKKSFRPFWLFFIKPIFFWFLYYFNSFFFYSFLTLFSLWLRYFFQCLGKRYKFAFALKSSLIWFHTFENFSINFTKKNYYSLLNWIFLKNKKFNKDFSIDFWFHYVKQTQLFFFKKIWRRRYNNVYRFYNLLKPITF